MGFLSFLMLVAIAYLLWRIADYMPDVIFRLGEIQRDVAELRRRSGAPDAGPPPGPGSADD